MHISLAILITIFTATANVILSTTILIQSVKKSVQIFFAFLGYAISAWVIFNYLSNLPITGDIWFNRLTFTSATLIAWASLFFARSVPAQEKHAARSFTIFYTLFSLIMCALTLTPLIIRDIQAQYWGIDVIPGKLYGLFLLYFLFTIALSLYILIKKYQCNHGVDKIRIKFFLIAYILTFFFGSLTNLFIPFITHSAQSSVYGSFASLIFLLIITYSIKKHRLFDIQIQTQKILNTLVPVLGTFVIVTIMAFPLFQNTVWPRHYIGMSLIIATIIIYKTLEIITTRTALNHALFQTTYRFHQALQELAGKASTITDFEQLVSNITSVFTHQGHISQLAFVVINDPEQHSFQIYKNTGLPLKQLAVFNTQKIEDFFYHYLLNLREPLLIDELYYGQPKNVSTTDWHELQKQLEPLRGGVLIPLKVSHDLVGCIILGNKERSVAYTSEDLHVFTMITTPLAVAITKSIVFTQYREKIDALSMEKANLQNSMVELRNMKNEFLKIVDHQFNTPLSIIRGAFSMIRDGDVPLSEIREYVQDINPRIEEFHHIVRGMIEAAHFEGGTADMHFTPVALPVLLNDVITELQPRFTQHHVTLKLNIDPTVQRVTSDTEKLKFALRHVLENAMLFGAGHPIEIQLVQPNTKDVIVHIRDFGRGFSLEEAKHIGQKFYRGKNVTDFHANGSGLGLYNVRKIIKASGGQLTFSSPGVGKGSIFTMIFPKGAEFFKQMSLK